MKTAEQLVKEHMGDGLGEEEQSELEQLVMKAQGDAVRDCAVRAWEGVNMLRDEGETDLRSVREYAKSAVMTALTGKPVESLLEGD